MVKVSAFIITALATSASCLALGAREELFVLELAPGITRTVTESEKWELKRQGVRFFDITDADSFHLGATTKVTGDIQAAAVTYPAAVAHQAAVNALIPSLNISNLETTLTTFSNFYNRYYKSTYGKQSSNWLSAQIQSIITASNATAAVTVKPFEHSWGQNSLIATIPGQSTDTIILSAHQDSINQMNPSSGRAPGADDDGSASVEILEVLRVLLTDPQIAAGKAANTIEFHWYSAEEGGLLGSQAIFNSYKASGRVVKGMLHQDMTGYVKPGTTGTVGLFTDYVDTGLTAFVQKCIKAYTTLPVATSKCGYACSDHASAYKAGYPTALVSESSYDDSSPYLHTTKDTLDTVNFSHLLELTKVSLGVAYELGLATL
ncbi:hypothetical protein BX600DRAFT_513244 [Xylariales sp. PMI_506]|nr:hypothetical protein BX600DRAFT_513244 [Xylariales sp. PMI_506]